MTILLYAALRREEISQGYRQEIISNLKDRIVRKGEVELLKTYLRQMAQRKSEVDLMHLAEIVQSKTFLEGKAEFQNPIIDQFALRKEKEVVWILAPIVKHKDAVLAYQAKLIMLKLTSGDLGNDPAKWREWYRDQNK